MASHKGSALLQAEHFERLPARQARFQRTGYPLSQQALQALQAKGFARLFSHQAEAIDLATAGKSQNSHP